MEKIEKLIKLFQGSQNGKGIAVTGGGLSTTEKRKLIEKAKSAGIKLPKKGI